jgi:hypothetical protein
MAKRTAAKKNAESKKEFGLPAERKYPMPDASHARNAKARASQMEHQGKLSAADKKKIDTKADHVTHGIEGARGIEYSVSRARK